jgi:hypothetical protein
VTLRIPEDVGPLQRECRVARGSLTPWLPQIRA